MTGEQRQVIFEAILEAVETHAPQLEATVPVAIATDAALKIAERVDGRALGGE